MAGWAEEGDEPYPRHWSQRLGLLRSRPDPVGRASMRGGPSRRIVGEGCGGFRACAMPAAAGGDAAPRPRFRLACPVSSSPAVPSSDPRAGASRRQCEPGGARVRRNRRPSPRCRPARARPRVFRPPGGPTVHPPAAVHCAAAVCDRPASRAAAFGSCAGHDIVFGPTKSGRIYSSAGRLYAQDSAGNQTILSPHDPDTGEWIYYSRNVKTGKVVRVEMERLVKAVEKADWQEIFS